MVISAKENNKAKREDRNCVWRGYWEKRVIILDKNFREGLTALSQDLKEWESHVKIWWEVFQPEEIASGGSLRNLQCDEFKEEQWRVKNNKQKDGRKRRGQRGGVRLHSPLRVR